MNVCRPYVVGIGLWLATAMAAAGVVGLGGAGFPTAGKLSVARELLVLNGAECEPWIACDDALLRHHADEVVRGGRMLARIVDAPNVLLAIEDSMPEALDAARESLRLIQNQYKAGVIAYLDVVVVQASALSNERSALDLLQSQTQRLQGMHDELREARQALDERKLVERAKQLLIKQQGCSESEAYARLRQTAMNQGLRLDEVAQRLLALNAELPTASPRQKH